MLKYRRENVWNTGIAYSTNFQEMLIKQERSEINSELTYVYIEISTYVTLSGVKFEVLVHISTYYFGYSSLMKTIDV